AFVLPLIILVLAGNSVQLAVHGRFGTDSVFGTTLFVKAGVLAEGNVRSGYPAVVEQLRPVNRAARSVQARASGWASRFLLILPYYDYPLNLPIWAAVDDAARTHGQPSADVAREVALGVIRAAPVAYLQDVAMNTWAQWYVPDLMTANDAARLAAEVA